jgi:hypothetical protein
MSCIAQHARFEKPGIRRAGKLTVFEIALDCTGYVFIVKCFGDAIFAYALIVLIIKTSRGIVTTLGTLSVVFVETILTKSISCMPVFAIWFVAFCTYTKLSG